MPISNIWSIRYAGVTKTAASWGIKNITRSRKVDESSEQMTLTVDADFDGDPIFTEYAMLALYRDGVPVFYGIVTDVPREGGTEAESMSYVVADPWWYLENVKFQQQWISTNTAGGAAVQVTTTRSRCIVGQALTGVSLNMGRVMLEVLYYALYSAQGIGYPSTVDANGVPTAPSMTAGPFRVGVVTPGMTEPFFEVTDKYCSDLMQMLLRYVPDCVKWFDYSTLAFDPGTGALSMPPTLNIDVRGNLTPKTIAVKSPMPSGAWVTNKFSPRALYKLQVPLVILKYEQVNSLDGQSYDNLVVDKYPEDVAENIERAFVQTIDLTPGNSTYQHQDVTVQNLPVSASGSATLPWIKNHIPWLFGSTSAPSPYDVANIDVLDFLGTDLDPQDPAVTSPPAGFALVSLVAELTSGQIQKWMTDDQQIFGANVVLSFRLGYTGTDAATLALFQTDPAANPNTRIVYITVKGTNAQTQTYKQLTSFTPAEPVPLGNAQLLYETMSVLHYKGTIDLLEPECSDLLPIGTVFNTTDGRAEWQAMNALVIGIEEDLGAGKTKVEFGPTSALGAQDLVELDRANRGRVVSWRLNQRTNGKAGEDSAVIGSTHAPFLSVSTPPGGGADAPNYPFAILTRVTPGTSGSGTTYQRKVILDSTLCKTPNLYDNLAITGLDTWVNLDANDTVWMLGTVVVTGGIPAVTPGTVTIHSFGNGDADYNPTAVPWTTGGVVENDGATPPNQTLFRKVIATFIADSTGKPSLQQQWVSTTQLMKNTAFNGEAAFYPGSFS